MMRRLLLAACFALTAGAASAQQPGPQPPWPTRTVRLILPFAAGGAADVVARIAAQAVGESTGQSFVVENRTGGSGNIGTEAAARAAPDGYTFLVGSPGTLAINPHMYARLPYDVSRDFVMVSHVASFPQVLVIHPSLPATTLQEFIALARREPGRLAYGSSGNASTGHLITEMFRSEAGIQLEHAPFRGGAPAAQALVAGTVQMVIDGLPTWLSYMSGNQIRVLAVTSAQRWPGLPDVPTIAEAAIPGFDLGSWVVLAAPTGTPAPILERFAAEVDRAVSRDDVRQRLATVGALPVGGTAADAQRFQREELAKWQRVVQVSGARVE
jgi:tripartite-type tricarboxylate transporter receptor subunit TctC